MSKKRADGNVSLKLTIRWQTCLIVYRASLELDDLDMVFGIFRASTLSEFAESICSIIVFQSIHGNEPTTLLFTLLYRYDLSYHMPSPQQSTHKFENDQTCQGCTFSLCPLLRFSSGPALIGHGPCGNTTSEQGGRNGVTSLGAFGVKMWEYMASLTFWMTVHKYIYIMSACVRVCVCACCTCFRKKVNDLYEY